MKNIQRIICFITVMLPLLGHAQKVAYGYDAAGNRISRYKVVHSRRSPASNESLLFKAVPNPVSDILRVSFENETDFQGSYQYSLQSMYGEVVATGECNTAGCQLDVSALPSGVYILRIIYQDNEQSIKIIKK